MTSFESLHKLFPLPRLAWQASSLLGRLILTHLSKFSSKPLLQTAFSGLPWLPSESLVPCWAPWAICAQPSHSTDTESHLPIPVSSTTTRPQVPWGQGWCLVLGDPPHTLSPFLSPYILFIIYVCINNIGNWQSLIRLWNEYMNQYNSIYSLKQQSGIRKLVQPK